MIVPIVALDIQANEVCHLLSEYGIVVLETTRTHARTITRNVITT